MQAAQGGRLGQRIVSRPAMQNAREPDFERQIPAFRTGLRNAARRSHSSKTDWRLSIMPRLVPVPNRWSGGPDDRNLTPLGEFLVHQVNHLPQPSEGALVELERQPG